MLTTTDFPETSTISEENGHNCKYFHIHRDTFCGPPPLDVVILLDSSSSISKDYYILYKTWIGNLVETMFLEENTNVKTDMFPFYV